MLKNNNFVLMKNKFPYITLEKIDENLEYFVREISNIKRKNQFRNITIINLDNKEAVDISRDINSTKYYFSKDSKQRVYLYNDAIYYGDELVIECKDIKLKGVHNYENIMAVISAVKVYGIDNELTSLFTYNNHNYNLGNNSDRYTDDSGFFYSCSRINILAWHIVSQDVTLGN